MSITIKAVERAQPGVAGGGVKKWYASPVMEAKDLTLDGLTKGIERASTVNGADIRAVLYAMVEQAVDALNEGKIVRLGDLGSLRITLSSEGKATAEEVTAHTVKTAGVIFTPGSKLKEMLANAKFTKI